MPNDLGDIRRSQVITSHGPGSVIDFRAGGHGGAGVSVVGAGLEEWDHWAPPAGLGNPKPSTSPDSKTSLASEGLGSPQWRHRLLRGSTHTVPVG